MSSPTKCINDEQISGKNTASTIVNDPSPVFGFCDENSGQKNRKKADPELEEEEKETDQKAD